MTPAVHTAQQARIPFRLHEYDHDPGANSYGDEAAAKLGVDPDRVFKTLVAASDDGRLAVAVLPVSAQLDLKRFAKVLGAKKAAMADKPQVERATGYVLGGVSPLGQKKRLRTVIDASAAQHDTVYISAGKRGLQMELAPGDLAELTGARLEAIGRRSCPT
jgi:Cys-tRNA(Pro)/Cys-tRNA(Cys) deacylase